MLKFGSETVEAGSAGKPLRQNQIKALQHFHGWWRHPNKFGLVIWLFSLKIHRKPGLRDTVIFDQRGPHQRNAR